MESRVDCRGIAPHRFPAFRLSPHAPYFSKSAEHADSDFFQTNLPLARVLKCGYNRVVTERLNGIRLEGLQAPIGVEYPVTWHSGYWGISREGWYTPADLRRFAIQREKRPMPLTRSNTEPGSGIMIDSGLLRWPGRYLPSWRGVRTRRGWQWTR